MSWEFRRKVMYALATITAVAALVVFLLRDTLFPAPTCVDKKQNGYEVGVDCGGVCALRCSSEVSPINVLFAKALPVGPGVYDLVGMVDNGNINNASVSTKYVFSLYNSQGQEIPGVRGETIIPLGGKSPIIVQNVRLSQRPYNVLLTLSDGPHFKVEEIPTSPTIKVLDRHYEPNPMTPRVYATLANTKQKELRNLPVRIVLFDDSDNVYAVGQTIVPRLGKEEVQEVIVTWDSSLPKTPTRIGVYPIFNPFDAIGY